MSVKLNQHSFFKYMLTNYKETKVPTVSCNVDLTVVWMFCCPLLEIL